MDEFPDIGCLSIAEKKRLNSWAVTAAGVGARPGDTIGRIRSINDVAVSSQRRDGYNQGNLQREAANRSGGFYRSKIRYGRRAKVRSNPSLSPRLVQM